MKGVRKKVVRKKDVGKKVFRKRDVSKKAASKVDVNASSDNHNDTNNKTRKTVVFDIYEATELSLQPALSDHSWTNTRSHLQPMSAWDLPAVTPTMIPTRIPAHHWLSGSTHNDTNKNTSTSVVPLLTGQSHQILVLNGFSMHMGSK